MKEEPTTDPKDAESASRAEAKDARDEAAPASAKKDTLAKKAVRGAFWTILTGVGARIVSLFATLWIARYIDPEEYGEVTNTFVVITMADLIAQAGLAQFIAARAQASRKVVFHATFYYHLFGVVALAFCLLNDHWMGNYVGAPHMALYMPGFVVAHVFQRISTIPDRLLSREMRFREAGTIQGIGEITYAVVSLGLAMFARGKTASFLGMTFVFAGGFSIVWGNIARGVIRMVLSLRATRLSDWLTPHRIEAGTSKEVLGFGLPLLLAALAGMAARRGDNLMVGNLYGPFSLGLYNYAYNLADVPPSMVGERLGDVFVPMFSQVESEKRSAVLVRSVAQSALLCFPLGVGLSAVGPSIQWLFNEKWRDAIPMMMILGALSLTRPVIGAIFSFLQVLRRTMSLMALEWMKAILVTVGILVACKTARAVAPEWEHANGMWLVCCTVGVVFAISTLGYQLMGAWAAGLRWHDLLTPTFRPLLACAPMVIAILLVRRLFPDHPSNLLLVGRMLVEVAVGAIVFAGSALVIARETSRDFLLQLRRALGRRSGAGG